MRLKRRLEKIEKKLGPKSEEKVFDPLDPKDLEEILHLPERKRIRVKLSLIGKIRELLGGEVDWEKIPSEEITVGEARKMIMIAGPPLGLLPEGESKLAA